MTSAYPTPTQADQLDLIVTMLPKIYNISCIFQRWVMLSTYLAREKVVLG